MQNILLYYLYKLQFVQKLLPHDSESRHRFLLKFLDRFDVASECLLDRCRALSFGRFGKYLQLLNLGNRKSCSILQVPLQSPKIMVWRGFTESFILGPYFFKELRARDPVTHSITGQQYILLLENNIVPYLQAR